MPDFENNSIHHLFWFENHVETSSRIILSPEESRHLIKTLRKRKGDSIYGTDGKGWLIKGLIEKSSSSETVVTVIKREMTYPLKPKLILASALIRPQLFEWIIEKVSELGVTKIIPLITEFVEHPQTKSDRWKKIAVSAMKQSLQCYLTEISPAIPLNEFPEIIGHIPYSNRLLAMDSHSPNMVSSLSPDKTRPVVIVTGPEGGFSQQEIHLFNQNQFSEVRLSPNRLRAETAAIAAIAQLQDHLSHDK